MKRLPCGPTATPVGRAIYDELSGEPRPEKNGTLWAVGSLQLTAVAGASPFIATK